MDKITLKIDGKDVQVSEGTTVLEAAKQFGINIPALCSYPGLKPLSEIVPDGGCKVCVVDIDGEIALSCATNVSENMVVKTSTKDVLELRERNLKAIMRRHPCSCLCPNNGRCDLVDAGKTIGITDAPVSMPKGLGKVEDSPFFVRNHDLCILCHRCIRVCDEIRGNKVLNYAYPCHNACPAGIDIPRYVRLIGEGRPSAALAVIREKVPFPGSLGRVCIHPCEGACQRSETDSPMMIRVLKRFAADHGDDSWRERSKVLPSTGRRVAVVGAGPAGLTAAFYLAKMGHGVTVFESLPVAGGMMRVGIPEYRLPRDILDGEVEEIRRVGVEIKFNTRIESLDGLFKDGYNAIYLAVGAHKGMLLGLDGEQEAGVMDSADFLRRINLGEKIDVGKSVGVIGGGNVAIDAARISLRLGAEKVTILYRRTRAEMPANPEEIVAALEEGIEMLFLAAPSSVIREDGIIKLECIRMELGEPDASGRRRPVPVEGSNFVVELDTLIAAIGQRPDVPKDFGVEVHRWAAIKADETGKTSREGVFTGGDCETGPDTVIAAIAAGRTGAQSIDKYLGGEGMIEESLVDPKEASVWLKEDIKEGRQGHFKHLPPNTRLRTYEEVEAGMEEEVAISEARRCLKCHVITTANNVTLEEAGCQFCGACVDACPVGALMEKSILNNDLPEKVVTTICPYCGTGCQLNLEIKDNRIIRVKPDINGPVNKGQACVKGKFGLDFVHDDARLTSPLIKKNGVFVEAGWDEALELIASKFSKCKGDQFAAVASARCTNEDSYVFQKFTRKIMGTNNIDHCARL